MVKKENSHIIAMLKLMHLSEKLKDEMRHQWTSEGRQESVAEHSWRLSLLVLLCYNHVKAPLDFKKVISMAIIHDIVEAEAGDQHFLVSDEILLETQAVNELKSIKNIRDILGNETGEYFFSIWNEFNELTSYEAKFVRALDKIEGYIQQNEANISTWTEEETLSVFYFLDSFCDFDPFLHELKEHVVAESLEKIKKSKMDITALFNSKGKELISNPLVMRRKEYLNG